ncbi:amidophosphoribosyltransferase [Proteiniborus ethanoligenes]|uniref:Amidophosphoribosyltransferase n=1 Tax=Proteiniborus ethanoligenes TaxID=415015 RepID=A0A1H3S8H0_9FIRM|nr:amidophosphoribosyltransferase [Proteiniborus ethanoligenes]SDZ33429.1 amidophosphoribosyltransferase [Proteiniborus ethanoligenes]
MGFKLIDDDKLKEECGVIGVYSKEDNVVEMIYHGLYALQHRGQESAGIATSSNGTINYHKNMGLVSEVFSSEKLEKLEGNMGIGHVRYSTAEENLGINAQPLVVKYKKGSIAIAHNGSIVNGESLREILEDEGVVFQTTNDCEVMANMIARYHKDEIEKAINRVMEVFKGSYALVLMTNDKLIGVRDNQGIRPLCLGKIKDGYVLASESCALDTIGAEFVRDIEPGEMVIIDGNGIKSIFNDKWSKKRLCIFEIVYFARPDSRIDDISVYLARKEAGKILAREYPVDADIVISVPDSGTSAAIGYAEESGIPYSIGLIKNRYIGRTFIKPNQSNREQGVKIKLNVLKENIQGKRVVLVDDSIVRGTTSKRIVSMLKKAGAKEVHLRISSPSVAYPCYFGIDTPYREHLVGANKTMDEICQMVNADSLGFLSEEGLIKSTGKAEGFCLACLNGDYPMEIPREEAVLNE